ncbi:hypothetical protein N0V83_006720 [Neocucurbitaria cava]|uniref:Uncharacterized protein n=1 Tax=Neocucurbitaria cava TaxID=798079 RepID=A0A9W8Y6H3_9PLEO|nr:hypothetical protein N0V83_006720 [Neocucurbitaria cava]
MTATSNTPPPYTSTNTPGLGILARLPPEIRNTIYSILLSSPSPFFVVRAVQTAGKFKLREWTDKPQHDILATLQALGYVSHDSRQETRTYFYSRNDVLVLCYGYEYLTIFVRWLEKIGTECRAVLRKVMLSGCMWYQPSQPLTQRLHSLLCECSNTRHLNIQLNIRHFCESNLPELSAYLNYMGPEPHDGPLPRIDVSPWTQVIVASKHLETFELGLVLSADNEMVRTERRLNVQEFSEDRGDALARDVEQRLRVGVQEICEGRDVEIRVRYKGRDERKYYLLGLW